MTTINNVKKSGEEFLRSVCANKTVLVFANIGLGTSIISGSERQFIQHIGAYSPFQKNGQLYKAIAGPELCQQMIENKDNVKFMSRMKNMGYTLDSDSVIYSQAYQCSTPSEAIRSMFSFISNLKKSQRKICFILKDEDQVKLFGKFFIPSFIKLDAKVKNFMCTSLDSILRSVRSTVDIESLPTLQSAEEKKEKLSQLLSVRSDLLCVSLYESFSILVHQHQVLQSVMRSLLTITNDSHQNQSSEITQAAKQDSYMLKPKKEEITDNPDQGDSSFNFTVTKKEDSLLLAESETSQDDFQIEAELKESPSLLKANVLLNSKPHIRKDFFNPESSLTMFVQPVFYENVKKFKATSMTNLSHLLYLQCHLHPTSEEFKVAIKPGNNLLRGDNINNEHFYEVKPNFTRYLNKDGTSLTCWTLKTTFDLLDSFITTSRKKNPAKQFNLFVKEFETFKKLLLIAEFKELLTRFDCIVTLYNKKTGSLARVPDLPLKEMTDYLNTIMSQDPSCVLHTELVSSMYSGSLL